MKYHHLLCGLLLLASCNTYPKKPKPPFAKISPGKYISYTPGYPERLCLYPQGIRRYFLGITLTVHEDSTYQMEGCTISRGRWRSDSGRLYLYMTYHNWVQDSLQQYGFKGKWPEIRKEPQQLLIDGDQVYELIPEWKGIMLLQRQKGS